MMEWKCKLICRKNTTSERTENWVFFFYSSHFSYPATSQRNNYFSISINMIIYYDFSHVTIDCSLEPNTKLKLKLPSFEYTLFMELWRCFHVHGVTLAWYHAQLESNKTSSPNFLQFIISFINDLKGAKFAATWCCLECNEAVKNKSKTVRTTSRINFTSGETV